MSTKSLVSKLMSRVGSGWSPDSGPRSILKLIEQGVDELYKDTETARTFRGTDNQGFPPYLITTDNVYQYNITGANLSCTTITVTIAGQSYEVDVDYVIGVFVDTEGEVDYTRRYSGPAIEWHSLNPYTNENTRLWVRQIPVNKTPSYEDIPPTVMFLENPGATTEKYYINFVWKPPRLLSTSIPLVIPQDFEKALEEYVIGEVQAIESGLPSVWQDKFEREHKPKFRRYMSTRCSQARNTSVTPRIC